MTLAKESETPCQTAPAAPLTCEVLTDFSMLEGLSDDWQRLRASGPKAEVFQEFGWVRAFWRAFGNGLSLCAPVVRREGKVIGILPLVRRGKLLEFLGSPDADYNDLLSAESDAPAVLAAALRTLLEKDSGWHTCALDNLPEDGLIVRYGKTLPPELARHVQLTRRCPCPTILLGAERAITLRSLLQKESLKRHQKKLEKVGKLSFRHLEDRSEICNYLDTFFAQHVARHAMNGDRSQFLRAGQRAFYRALVEELDPHSSLRFAVLELDGNPVAFHFGYQLNGKYVWYKPTFSVDYWELAPGEVLLRKLLEYCRDHPEVGEFDFTVGDEQFKTRFANLIRYNFALYVDRQPTSARTQAERLLRRARERLKEHPRALNVVRDASVQWHWLRDAIARQGARAVTFKLVGNGLRWLADCSRVCVYSSPEMNGIDGASMTATAASCVPERLTLSELATWGAESDWLRASELQAARERLKQGQQIYGIRRAGVIVAFAWIDGQENSARWQDIGLQGQGAVIHGLVFRSVQEIAPEELAAGLLGAMTQLSVTSQGKTWFICAENDKNAQAGAVAAGFQLRCLVIRVSLFGKVRQMWIHKVTQKALLTCPAASNVGESTRTRFSSPG